MQKIEAPLPQKRNLRSKAKYAGAFIASTVSLMGALPHSAAASPTEHPSHFLQTEIDEIHTQFYESGQGSIEIIGNDNFIEQTTAALDLLQAKAPEYFQLVVKNMGIILRVKTGSSMQVDENPPRFFASDRLFEAGIPWYAGDIVHDANHERQWRSYHEAHPNEPVPTDVFYGEKAEKECIAVQAKVLKEIGAPKDQIDWLVNHAADTHYWTTPASQHNY
jgi:hypothetical protein